MDFTLNEQQRSLVGWASELAQRQLAPDAFTWEQRDSPETFFAHAQKLADHGLLGLVLPTAQGGGGLPRLDAMLVVEAIARVCPFSANVVRWPNAGPAAFIAELGSEQQRAKYLPDVIGGTATISIAMTEPDAGTSSSQLLTTATLGDGDQLSLTGNKIFISNADRATAFVVYARFTGATQHEGVGAVIVDRDCDGVAVGEPIRWMGGSVYPVHFDQVVVERSQVLIHPAGDTASYKRLMQTYNLERLGGLFELLGIAQMALDRTSAYVSERHQFGKPIAQFQAVQMRLADMAMRLEAARWLTYRATAEAAEGRAARSTVSMARVTTTEMVQFVTDQAIQLHGGYGLTQEFGLEWLYRSTRHQSIAGGTSDIHRSMISSDLTGLRFDHWK